ncbi:pyrroloquinoline quinone biosynthesis peptide chaperone PqqD [Poseidonocella sp. HB161398]|uniref:pyrroloquinoline quinone biosynthesis peptide chaperone PqqD n=1 Tax=Poseidonocella sp. HB161398 TaxID=2320855 RepID=UPI001108FE33|nr:pyrroloquinoline quinone biosynthesis peptide chaperone PqqD [Poseidonocella sp. HB161398]
MSLSAASVPVLPRGVRLHEDKVRGGWVLLAPERALSLDSIGLAILTEIDGRRSLGEISEDLAARYEAPAAAILSDCIDYLGALCDRRILEAAP